MTQWKNVQQRLLRDTAGPHGMQEIILIEWKIMDSSAHWFTVEPHGRLETIVTQWKHMAQRLHCDPVGLMKFKRGL